MRLLTPRWLMTRAVMALPIWIGAANAAPTDRLREMLQHMPVEGVSTTSPLLAIYADPGAVDRADGPPSQVVLGSMIWPLAALSMAGRDVWSAETGMPAGEIGSFLTFGQPPKNVTIWGHLPNAEKHLKPNLQERGFTAVTDMPGIYGNGEPMVPNLARQSLGNPWRGAAGQASFIAFDDCAIIQATTPEAVAAVSDPGQTVAALVFVKTALDAIDSAAGDALITQAAFFSTAAGLDHALPEGFLSADPKTFQELAASLQSEIETPQSGIPPYFGGFLADARISGHPALLIAVTYPSCDDAEEAASGIEALWQTEEVEGKPMADQIPGTLTADHIEGGSLCAAIVTITGAPDTAAPRPFDFAATALMRGSFPLLRIGLQ